MSPSTVKLILLTSSDLVRSGIQMLIQTTPSVEIVRAFTCLSACEAYLQQHPADVLLLDDSLPEPQPPQRMIRLLLSANPTLRILILSDYLNEIYVQRFLEAGVSGFIYKGDQLEHTLVAGIRNVRLGHIFLSPQVSALPYENVSGGDLNRTDLAVLRLIARGYTVQEISSRVGIVKNSVYRIRRKLRGHLNVRTNEQLVEAARRRGLIQS